MTVTENRIFQKDKSTKFTAMTLKPWPTTLTDSCFYFTKTAVNIWTEYEQFDPKNPCMGHPEISV